MTLSALEHASVLLRSRAGLKADPSSATRLERLLQESATHAGIPVNTYVDLVAQGIPRSNEQSLARILQVTQSTAHVARTILATGFHALLDLFFESFSKISLRASFVCLPSSISLINARMRYRMIKPGSAIKIAKM